VLGAAEVEAFLTHLAVNRGVGAVSQNQALNALIFLYKEVLKVELEGIDARRAKHAPKLPIVLTTQETGALLRGVTGGRWGQVENFAHRSASHAGTSAPASAFDQSKVLNLTPSTPSTHRSSRGQDRTNWMHSVGPSLSPSILVKLSPFAVHVFACVEQASMV
jgi:hypothetical protein